MVAGVEGPVRFRPRAAGNPVARLTGKEASACTPLPISFFAAQCAGVGIIHILQALGVELRLLGVDVDVDAVRAAAAVRAHNRQPVAWRGEEKTTKISSWELSARRHRTCRRKRPLRLVPLSLGSVGISVS